MATPAPTSGTTTPPRGPWWKHYLYGVTAILTGAALVVLRPAEATEGVALMGAGVAFLGVGAGQNLTG